MYTTIFVYVIMLLCLNANYVAANTEHKMDSSEIQLAEYNERGIDYSFVNSIPNLAIKYFNESKATENDSSPDISRKRNKYFENLKQIELELIKRYFIHDEMQISQLNAINDIAELKANLHYPLTFSAGCSMHDYYVEIEKIRMIREIIYLSITEFYKVAKLYKSKAGDLLELSVWLTEWNKSEIKENTI